MPKRKFTTEEPTTSEDADETPIPEEQLTLKLRAVKLSQAVCREVFNVDFHISYFDSFLDLDVADGLFHYCESTLKYYDGELTMVRVFNRWHRIPRKQVAFADAGYTYHFSGNTIPAMPWNAVLDTLRNVVSHAVKCQFNFVLVNRYADGNDYIGEHKDNEKDLDPASPIASLTLGATRDLIFRHEHEKRKLSASAPEPLCMPLPHGSLLVMHPETNRHWYHCLPRRKRVKECRINFTFRKMSIAARQQVND